MPQSRRKPKRKRAPSPDADPENIKRRTASVYDAVEGRVTTNGLEIAPTVPLPPDEALFKRKNAPVRYQEDDIYFADRHLQSHQRLPDSDLLTGIHAYAADLYADSLGTRARRDWRSKDETALLALGILLEEAAVEVLGETGDLAFTEAEVVDVPSKTGGAASIGGEEVDDDASMEEDDDHASEADVDSSSAVDGSSRTLSVVDKIPPEVYYEYYIRRWPEFQKTTHSAHLTVAERLIVVTQELLQKLSQQRGKIVYGKY